MEIRILGSGSSGNCYWVSDGVSPLLIECGLPVRKIREALDFKLSDLAGCLVSHEHGDHSKAARDLMKAGVDIYASAGTLDVLGLEGHRTLSLWKANGEYVEVNVGSWLVTPFAAVHDAAEPLGFILDSDATGERLFYSGDTGYISPRIAGMTDILVEANNTWEAVRAGEAPRSLKERVVANHMSLETVKGFLAANDLSRVKVIYLLHLSDEHSDADLFRREVMEQTGKEVRIG
jgi:phosphoribosyl 1,2-cyclic phosphodiesterase